MAHPVISNIWTTVEKEIGQFFHSQKTSYLGNKLLEPVLQFYTFTSYSLIPKSGAAIFLSLLQQFFLIVQKK